MSTILLSFLGDTIEEFKECASSEHRYYELLFDAFKTTLPSYVDEEKGRMCRLEIFGLLRENVDTLENLEFDQETIDNLCIIISHNDISTSVNAMVKNDIRKSVERVPVELSESEEEDENVLNDTHTNVNDTNI
jgi:hypothetical protein